MLMTSYLTCNGLDLLLLLDARIVYSSRNALDNCFSISSGAVIGAGFRCAYTLQDVGEYYCSSFDLMEHWHKVIPEVYEISNESLIAAPEEGAKRLVAFCGLGWNGALLSDHEKPASKPVRCRLIIALLDVVSTMRRVCSLRLMRLVIWPEK